MVDSTSTPPANTMTRPRFRAWVRSRPPGEGCDRVAFCAPLSANDASLSGMKQAADSYSSARANGNVVEVSDPDGMRASDSEREAAVERLRTASAEGRLSLEELIGRTEAAYSATTRSELATVTTDLPEQESHPPAMQPAHAQRMVSVFADVSRRGWWRAEGTVSPMTVFGDVELDLRQAAVPTGHLNISAVAPFGDIEVIVPDGVIVELSGFSLFGRKKVDVRRSSSMQAPPVVRVQGFTVFGSVLVRS